MMRKQNYANKEMVKIQPDKSNKRKGKTKTTF